MEDNDTPCGCEEEAPPVDGRVYQQPLGFAGLGAPVPLEPTYENLLAAVEVAADTFKREMDKHLEMRQFLVHNDVPNSVISALFNNYRYYLQA